MGTVLVAHPSGDLYGADHQLLESVRGLVSAGWRVVVHLSEAGPLVERLEDAGASVETVAAPVLRKSLLTPRGLVRLLVGTTRVLPELLRRLRVERPDVVYVNTVTVPVWLLAARLSRRPALCHVHEAEEARWVSLALGAPLFLSRTVVVNSAATARNLLRVHPRLRDRMVLVYNGVPGPTTTVEPARPSPGRRRVLLVGRLSRRKGTDVAVEALAHLRGQGRDVQLELCGSVFRGYEWFEDRLRSRSSSPDLAGAVLFSGHTSPVWPALARSEIVVVPSRTEPLGITAVEAQLAARPVIATTVQGLPEVVSDGETGLLVPPDDPPALAAAIARLLDDPDLADRLAVAGRTAASTRFSPERYRTDIVASVRAIAGHSQLNRHR
jgi:hypothetical protein